MKQRILVVDDDQLVADTLSLIYEANGFEARACYSAAEGLEHARSFAPALVLCDVSMPDESGLVLAEQVNREMPECEVLMLTAYSSNQVSVLLHSMRMQRPLKLLAKPCPPDELLRETRALLPNPAPAAA
ncbi:MAG: response regulator [Acidobacteriaceae bacterium]|nr:response regulator [Acidobacteriaceae bacterium]